MIHDNVELHNVAEVHPAAGGVRLQRVPEAVRRELNESARMRVLQPDNCEVRFVCDSHEAEVTLSSEGATDVTVFYGPFDARQRFTLGAEPVTIRTSPTQRLGLLPPERWADQPFSPRVRRIVFGGRRRDPVILHGVRADGLRPPEPEELPKRRYLAYGTSITHGFDCEGPHLSYVAQAAWHLGADLVNLGVGGACHAEKAFADYIAGRTDWDVATLALSVNMQGFAMDEFRRRIAYMVDAVGGSDTRRPVACITLFTYWRDLMSDLPGDGPFGGTPEEYRQALRDVVAASPHPNVHLIEGREMLTNIGGLTTDLIHPSDHAMIEMGRRVAERLKAILAAGDGVA